MRNGLAVAAVALALSACTRDAPQDGVLDLTPRRHPLVDNLFVVTPRPGGGLAPLGGAVGRFSLEGRCLVVRTDGTPRTPVFANDHVQMTGSGLTVGREAIRLGTDVRLPMISGPLRLRRAGNARCPSEGAFIRAVEP